MFGSRQQLMKSTIITRLNANNTQVLVSDCIKYIGVHLDKNLNFKKHLTAKCKVASLNLFRIRNIRKYLIHEVCTVMVLGLVVVHLEYANELFVGLPEVEYNVLVTVLRCLNNQAPGYLKSMLQRPTRIGNIQSPKDLRLLILPSTKKKIFANGSFTVTGPIIWNQFPIKLRHLASLHDFKKQFKTFLFEKFQLNIL